MPRLLSLLLFLLGSLAALAQQDPQFSMNSHNRLFPNPGVAGSNNQICGSLLARNQWTGFEGRPQSTVFSLHGPVKKLHGGVGVSILADRLGQESTTGIKLAYAYRWSVPGTRDGVLGIGAATGLTRKAQKADYRYPGAGVVNDPNLNLAPVAITRVDFDFGLYYKTRKLYFGLSTTHLNTAEYEESDGYQFVYRQTRHYYVMAGYTHSLRTLPIDIEPSLFVKSDGVSTQVDVNVTGTYKKLFWGGLSYRYQDAGVIMAGLFREIGPLNAKFGYAYDVTTSKLRQHSSGSHELMVGFCLPIPVHTRGSVHPRFLHRGWVE